MPGSTSYQSCCPMLYRMFVNIVKRFLLSIVFSSACKQRVLCEENSFSTSLSHVSFLDKIFHRRVFAPKLTSHCLYSFNILGKTNMPFLLLWLDSMAPWLHVLLHSEGGWFGCFGFEAKQFNKPFYVLISVLQRSQGRRCPMISNCYSIHRRWQKYIQPAWTQLLQISPGRSSWVTGRK